MSRHRGTVCYNCGKIGHYSDRCPNNGVEIPGFKLVTCFKCGMKGHYSDKCTQIILPPSFSSRLPVSMKSSKKFKIGLKFDGWWGKVNAKSAYLHPECEAFKLKRSFIDCLLSAGYITDADMDVRNQIPHIALRNSDEEGDNTYKALDGKVLEISITSFKIHDDFVELDVGQGKHMTLFWCKGLFNRIDKNLVTAMLLDILLPYEIKEELNDPEEENREGESKTCKVCMDNSADTLLQPCDHLCVCMACAGRLFNCPICREKIVTFKKIFIC